MGLSLAAPHGHHDVGLSPATPHGHHENIGAAQNDLEISMEGLIQICCSSNFGTNLKNDESIATGNLLLECWRSRIMPSSALHCNA